MTTSGVGPGGQWQSGADVPNESNEMRLVDATAPAASSAASGSPGDFALTSSYLYVYVASVPAWRRIPLEIY